MDRPLLAWLALSAVGLFVVALPDADNRLFSLSSAHGPSPLDAVGLTRLLTGWLVAAVAVWRRRSYVRQGASSGAAALVAFAGRLGLGLLVASVASDYDRWWIIGAAMLLVAQLAVARWANG